MHKIYKTPAVKIVYLNEADIIATSDRGLVINPDENVNLVDKAPSRTIWGDE